MSRPNGVPLFAFRGLVEFDRRYNVYAGYCLETGSVVTADDADAAQEMLKELLEDEISFAIKHNNVRNLLSSPADLTVWRKWQELANIQEPVVVYLNTSAQEVTLEEPEVEISFAKAA